MGGDDMTRPSKVHYLRRVADETPRGLCHVTPKPWHVTRTREEVTCGLCQRELAAVGCAPEEVCEDAPVFVPHEVDSMRGTSSPAGHAGFIGPWQRVDWPSLDVALLTYWTIRRDRYPSKSVTEMLETYAMLGDRVDGGGSKEPRALRMADGIADIEIAAKAAFAPHAWQDGISGVQAWLLMLHRASTQLALSDVAAEVGVPWSRAAGTLLRGRRRMRIEMGARGLIRADGDAVDARRRELGAM